MRERFAEAGDKDALVWRDQSYSYRYLLERVDAWNEKLDEAGIGHGTVVAVEADFSPRAIAIPFSTLPT